MRRLMVSDLMGAPLRNRVRRLYAALPLHWFVAILVAIDGFIFVQPGLSAVNKGGPQSWLSWFSIDNVHVFLHSVGLVQLPHLVLGMCLQVMAIGLVLRARIAWAFSLLLLIVTGTVALSNPGGQHVGLAVYTLVLLLVLVVYWQQIGRTSGRERVCQYV